MKRWKPPCASWRSFRGLSGFQQAFEPLGGSRCGHVPLRLLFTASLLGLRDRGGGGRRPSSSVRKTSGITLTQALPRRGYDMIRAGAGQDYPGDRAGRGVTGQDGAARRRHPTGAVSVQRTQDPHRGAHDRAGQLEKRVRALAVLRAQRAGAGARRPGVLLSHTNPLARSRSSVFTHRFAQ